MIFSSQLAQLDHNHSTYLNGTEPYTHISIV